MPQKVYPNLNFVWSAHLIEECIRLGIDYFCICPGSRSSPLTLAVAANSKARAHIHFDERANAFNALGYISAQRKPAAIITTSGTAVANLMPAVVEASKKKLPLIIFTADRPPELRQTGAHQTIDQVKIFGDAVRAFTDLPAPTTTIPLNYILTTIDQLIYQSQADLPGPVHLNCMFREPLSPIKKGDFSSTYLTSVENWAKSKKPFTQWHKPELTVRNQTLTNASATLNETKEGLIVVGKIKNGEEALVLKLAQKLNWPLFPDLTSNLRLANTASNCIHYFDQVLASEPKIKVETILHLGGRITSKRYYQFLENFQPKNYLMVLNHRLRNDPLHLVTERIQAPVGEFLSKILPLIKLQKKNTLLLQLNKLSKSVDNRIEKILLNKKLSEPHVARLISKHIKKDHGLFLSNSLPIRLMDFYADPKGNPVTISANRGASGIDGIIASACGFSTALQQPTTLLIGDLAALYDLNALAMLHQLKHPLSIVILNNDGGGIFSLLPVAQKNEHFEKYFSTPHGLDFKCAAHMFNLHYYQPKTAEEFVQNYQQTFKDKKSSIIEVKTKKSDTLKIMNKIQESTT